MDQMFSLNGKVIVITGAAGLLGKQHAEILAAYGANPILLDINRQSAEDFAEFLNGKYGVSSVGYGVNITKEEEIEANCRTIVSKFGKIDGLINNAANNPKVEDNSGKNFSRLENFPLDVWNADLSVGLTGAFLCAKYYGYQISLNPAGGSILNISSDLGIIAPDQRLYRRADLSEEQQPVKPITYSVTKTALIGLTRYLATYWAHKNVRCNAICPGGVENNQNEDFVKEVNHRIPLGRMARPNEYQGLVLFLMSDASGYLNGSIIAADGGRSVW